MNILIVFGTNSGGTHVASELVAAVFTAAGHTTTLKRANIVEPTEFAAYDLIIFGCCTWELVTQTRKFEGQLQEHFLLLQSKLKGKKFSGQRFAVFGLGDSSYTNFCIAANHLVALVKQIEGTQIGDTLRINKFFFNLNENRAAVTAWARSLVKILSVPSSKLIKQPA